MDRGAVARAGRGRARGDARAGRFAAHARAAGCVALSGRLANPGGGERLSNCERLTRSRPEHFHSRAGGRGWRRAQGSELCANARAAEKQYGQPARSRFAKAARNRRARAAQRGVDACSQRARIGADEQFQPAEKIQRRGGKNSVRRTESAAAARAVGGGFGARISHRHLGRRVEVVALALPPRGRLHDRGWNRNLRGRRGRHGAARRDDDARSGEQSRSHLAARNACCVDRLEPLRAIAGPEHLTRSSDARRHDQQRQRARDRAGRSAANEIHRDASLAAAAAIWPRLLASCAGGRSCGKLAAVSRR